MNTSIKDCFAPLTVKIAISGYYNELRLSFSFQTKIKSTPITSVETRSTTFGNTVLNNINWLLVDKNKNLDKFKEVV